MRRVVVFLLVAVFIFGPLTGCFTMKHTVGNGGGTQVAAAERQWFALWGLIPLGSKDGGQMAANAGLSDYTVQTQWSVVDIILNIFTGYITFYSRTVTVFK